MIDPLPMSVDHYFHLWIGGKWKLPFLEHVVALNLSGFNGSTKISIVGQPTDREMEFIEDCTENLENLEILHTAPQGFEQETLDLIYDHVQAHDGASPWVHQNPVMYAHNKGSYNHAAELEHLWRRSMTKYVIYNWQSNLELLNDHDAVGTHWFHPSMEGVVHAPHFGGNFWMATARYLRGLPRCIRTSRWDAEMWIGQHEPTVVNLYDGWPNIERYHLDGIR